MRPACWSRAAGVRADRIQGAGCPGAGAVAGAGAGACSRMRWALVPEIPKEETPARRGRPADGQGMALASRDIPASQSMWGEGWPAWSVAGSVPWRIAVIILIMPATPAALAVWAMLDFTDPIHSGWSRCWP